MTIVYKKGSLFDAPGESILVHACNTQGVWGSGIAKEFKEKFHFAFVKYEDYCKVDGKVRDLRGKFQCSYTKDGKHKIGSLFTSKGYGTNKDDVETICIFTVLAVREALLHATRFCENTNIHSIKICSNKFNSGLFEVPWERTEKIINSLLPNYPKVKWIVYEGL